LVGTLARVILGSAVQGPLVDVHPLDCDWMAGLGDHRVELDASWAADGWSVVQADAKQLGEQQWRR